MTARCLFALPFLAVAAWGQPSPVDFANLREDVQGLSQKVNDLSLRVEQLERENSDLQQRASASGKSYATVAQLNDAVADLNRTLQTAIAASNDETLQKVAAQMEKLARQVNAALDSMAKNPGPAAKPASGTAFTDDFPKQGLSYTVQKGDTLAVIAKKTGAKLGDIVAANKLADPSRIQIGQTLFIPGGK